MQKLLVNTSGFSREVASRMNAATLLGFMLLRPEADALSDRAGRRPLINGFGIAVVAGTWPI
jgi:MHS family alpha-ketoglutarate permease-like MFS transporter